MTVQQRARRVREANDPAQYDDDLAEEWWDPFGKFAALHWLAAARARLVPPPPYDGAPLLDVACGAGLLGPHLAPGTVTGTGSARWRHVGLDLSQLSLLLAREHGMTPLRANLLDLPFADGSLQCVVAGEILEHVEDLEGACAELARVLAPGGVLVIDTLADTWFARIALIHIAERFPGGPPPGIHRADLLVNRNRLRRALAAHGVRIDRMNGLRPSAPGYLRWLVRRAPAVRMVTVRSTAGVYQALAVKQALKEEA